MEKPDQDSNLQCSDLNVKLDSALDHSAKLLYLLNKWSIFQTLCTAKYQMNFWSLNNQLLASI